MGPICRPLLCLLFVLLGLGPARAEEITFRVASYNVENYLDKATESRKAKPADSKAKVKEMLLSAQPDVVAFQEMGTRSALLELQASLKQEGLDLPYVDWIEAWDTNIHLAVLSRYPFSRRVAHTNAVYLLSGRRLHVSRGFTEVDVQVNDDYEFTLFNAHLKSKRPVGVADQAEMRHEEAKLLRELVDARLQENPDANIIVCGDLNDTYNNAAIKTLVGRGQSGLKDLRPAENNGDNLPNPRNPRWNPRNITWTHHWGVEDSYSRIDYILASPGMMPEWRAEGTEVVTGPNWGLASDHRPIIAAFVASEN